MNTMNTKEFQEFQKHVQERPFAAIEIAIKALGYRKAILTNHETKLGLHIIECWNSYDKV